MHKAFCFTFGMLSGSREKFTYNFQPTEYPTQLEITQLSPNHVVQDKTRKNSMCFLSNPAFSCSVFMIRGLEKCIID